MCTTCSTVCMTMMSSMASHWSILYVFLYSRLTEKMVSEQKPENQWFATKSVYLFFYKNVDMDVLSTHQQLAIHYFEFILLRWDSRRRFLNFVFLFE